MQIPVIEWPFPEGNRVQVWAKALPNYAARMKWIGIAVNVQYKRIP